jgi:hypothetical protein
MIELLFLIFLLQKLLLFGIKCVNFFCPSTFVSVCERLIVILQADILLFKSTVLGSIFFILKISEL